MAGTDPLNDSNFYTAINLWFQQCTFDGTTLTENTDSDSSKYNPYINVYATYGLISNWRVGAVSQMTSAFNKDNANYHATTKARIPVFNGNISSWQTGAVVNMSYMFAGASAFNQDVSSWDTHLVENMYAMFSGATLFNNGQTTNLGEKPFIRTAGSVWDTVKVINMSYMFYGASAFNQDVSSWDTRAVIIMSGMFSGARVFNQDISSWDTRAVINMSGMFYEATLYNGLGIYKWKLLKPTIYGMFLDSAVPGKANDSLICKEWQQKYNYTNAELSEAGLTLYGKTAVAKQLQYNGGVVTFTLVKKTEKSGKVFV